jgi:hypothetical protein
MCFCCHLKKESFMMNTLGSRGLVGAIPQNSRCFFRGDDVVFFEVMEINGRYEAVKMLLPSMMETQLGSVTWWFAASPEQWMSPGEQLGNAWDMHLTNFWFGGIW